MSCQKLIAEERALIARLRATLDDLDALTADQANPADRPAFIVTEGTPITTALVSAIVSARGRGGILVIPAGVVE